MLRTLNKEEIARVHGGLAAVPVGVIVGGTLAGANYLAGSRRTLMGFGVAVMYGAIGGAVSASGAGIAMKLFGGALGSAGQWFAKKV